MNASISPFFTSKCPYAQKIVICLGFKFMILTSINIYCNFSCASSKYENTAEPLISYNENSFFCQPIKH
ncbi:hypothetical protein T4D_10869 [Trichinella pseudospiralis]|uniref:Uncharacterized protein n=1 Tax=Trichinella pseudospiralis TaxID=6337 RepID=A0A0V1FYK8_TRIPS|nr:hypothetical protein T4D_10869 [Trichinella pseudospiralis]